MIIAIHDHETNIHKLYDDSAGEVVILDESDATQLDVNANGHLVKDDGNWILEVHRPIVEPESPARQTSFAIGDVAEATALEKAKSIINRVLGSRFRKVRLVGQIPGDADLFRAVSG